MPGFNLPPSEAAQIQNAMLHAVDRLPSSVKAVDEATRFHDLRDQQYTTDTSFTRQMTQLVEDPSSVDPSVTTSPDAILLTANSAIPVADAVRGFYEAADIKLPVLSYIKASRNFADRVYPYGSTKTMQDHPEAKAELRRLRGILGGAEHVTVIDQYVCSGGTLDFATRLVRMLGSCTSITVMRGSWYVGVRRKDVDYTNVRASHRPLAALMRQIGHDAYAARH